MTRMGNHINKKKHMKIRNGFVSNSSSSSYIIQKNGLTEQQLEGIRNHIQVAQELMGKYHNLDFGCAELSDQWSIDEKEGSILAYTNMDNFDMHEFLIKGLRIPDNNIQWKDY